MPFKEDRERCFAMRDGYYKCLDKNYISWPRTDVDRSKCAESYKKMAANCSSAWVKFFERKRIVEKMKEKTGQKADPWLWVKESDIPAEFKKEFQENQQKYSGDHKKS